MKKARGKLRAFSSKEATMDFKRIKVEPTFSEFVATFRGGGTLDKFVQNIPPGLPNADFYFPADGIVAELKTLESDAYEPDLFGKRILRSVELSGYSFADYVKWVADQTPFPPEVLKRLNSMLARPIRECIKKAIRQISVTRRLLEKPDAHGLVLLANSGNYGLLPASIMDIAAREFEGAADKERDGIVYFTPNVLHKLVDNDIGYELWVPVANNAGDVLQKFIDDLGGAWFDYCEQFRPSADRQTGSDMSVLFNAKPTADRPS